MKNKFTTTVLVVVVGWILCLGVTTSAQRQRKITDQPAPAEVSAPAALPQSPQFMPLEWSTVANFATDVPELRGGKFDHFSLPSINNHGTVVFTGGRRDEKNISGLFIKRPRALGIDTLLGNYMGVPYPNNLGTTFNRFHGIPRIAPYSDKVVITGLHDPVYLFSQPDKNDMYLGHTGIYAVLEKEFAFTAASELGMVPGFEFYSVPGAEPTSFDGFFGYPTITDDGHMAFRAGYLGNTDPHAGIYVRQLHNTAGGGSEGNELIVDTETEVPDVPPIRSTLFGWTGTPSAAADWMVFSGAESDAPGVAGGLYLTPVKGGAGLTKLAAIGESLPGLKMPPVRTFGEAVAFDGRFVAFWAAWGEKDFKLLLWCPDTGDPELIHYCAGHDPASLFDEKTQRWYQVVAVPAEQGIFVLDTLTGSAVPVATTTDGFDDLIYWNYTGRFPNKAEPSNEPPKWRPEAYLAVADGRVAFKGRRGTVERGEYINPIDGIYLADPLAGLETMMVVETRMGGAYIDPQVPNTFRATLAIADVGLEREGMRGDKLAIRVMMSGGKTDWGGIYCANLADVKR